MKKLLFQGFEIEVDVDRTREFYDAHMGPCECDECINAGFIARKKMPAEARQLLESLGIDFLNPPFRHAESSTVRKIAGLQAYREVVGWSFFGSVSGTDVTPELRLRDGYRFRIDRSAQQMQSFSSDTSALRTDPDVCHVIGLNDIPWMFGELASICQRFEQPCDMCGHDYFIGGYLKRKGHLGEWLGMPDIRQLLRDRSHRVFISFCRKCGQPRYRAVANNPPFRTKDLIWRKKLRERRRLTKQWSINAKVYPATEFAKYENGAAYTVIIKRRDVKSSNERQRLQKL